MNKYKEALKEAYEMMNAADFGSMKKGCEALKVLQELVDKATPKKFYHISDGSVYCPNCDKILDKLYSRHHKYCSECGQALDWGDNS